MGVKQLLFLALICAGCARTSPWCYQEMSSSSPTYHSAQLTHTPTNIFTGLGLQLTQTAEGTRGYFNIYSRHITSAEGAVWIDEKPLFFKGTLLEGSQRLLLPPAVTEAIVESLLEEREVIASVQDYVSQFPATDFAKHYNKMQSTR